MGPVSEHPLTLLITGANGYLGREVVRQALIAGHQLILLVRDTRDCPVDWDIDQRITLQQADLAEVTNLPRSDVLIHLAATLSGDAQVQQRDTVEASRQVLIAAMRTGAPPALVLASSLSVYSATALSPGDLVTEQTPLEEDSHLRDAYCRAKLGQELLFSTAAADAGLALQLLRIGAIYGPGRLWNAHLGVPLGPLLLRSGRDGDLPLAHVRHAARALVLAAERAALGQSGVYNVVDSDLPDRGTYLRALRRSGWPKSVLPLPWTWLAAAARATQSRLNPGLLKLPTIRARLMPLRYDNRRLQQGLGWQPEADFDTLMAEALEAEHD